MKERALMKVQMESLSALHTPLRISKLVHLNDCSFQAAMS